MGDTIWVLPEGVEEDGWDHSLMLREDQNLDKLAEAIGVRKLSEFFDFSAYAEEVGAEAELNLIDPSEAATTVSALIKAIESGHSAYNPSSAEELLEELRDVLAKLEQAGQAGLRVRLSVIQ